MYLKYRSYRYIGNLYKHIELPTYTRWYIVRKRGIKRERIIRVLLNKPSGNITAYRVAIESQCSHSWVHEFLKKLETKELIKRTQVVNYVGLLNCWRKIRVKPEKKAFMHKKPLDLLRKTNLEYALTTYQAENMIQHYLFPTRTDIYIKKEDFEKWKELITIKGLVGKGNLRLLLKDDHVFYASFKKQGFKIVSRPQLIIDLFDEGSVCTEAAEMLLNKVKNYVI